MDGIDRRIITDLLALQGGRVEASRAPLYRAFLELGTIGDAEAREDAMQAVLDDADASGETHLSVLFRLAALPLLAERQRELVNDLLALLIPDEPQAT